MKQAFFNIPESTTLHPTPYTLKKAHELFLLTQKMEPVKITIQTTIQADIKTVWTRWNKPEHIVKWNFASDDWHCPSAENDLRPDGKFRSTMASKDGKMSFDFEGVYDEVIPYKKITYTLADGRNVGIEFESPGDTTKVTETFEAENENPVEMQKNGWQAILDNFKSYVEEG